MTCCLPAIPLDGYVMGSATVFLEYLRGILKYLRSHLISAVDFYCVINKLIILIPGSR
jgi:hypothetical protein